MSLCNMLNENGTSNPLVNFVRLLQVPPEKIATIKEYKDMHSQGESPGDDKNEK